MTPQRRDFIAVLVVTAVLGSIANAQTPDGWIVASSFRSPSALGPSGVYFVSPLGGTHQVVTGLPPIVNGTAYPTAPEVGTDFILRRPSDGALITNGWAVANVQMPLFILTLSGTVVTGGTTPYELGLILPQSVLGAPQAALLPTGQILVALDHVGVPGVQLVLVDPALGPPGTPGTVVPIPVSPQPPGRVNGLAVDPAANLIYIAMENVATNTSTIYSMPMGPMVSPVPLASVSGLVRNLAVDNDGLLLAAGGSGAQSLVLINPTTALMSPVAGAPLYINAVAVERVTGNYIVAAGTGNVFNIWRLPPAGGTPILISSGPAGSWGVLAGLDINPDPETYGAPTVTASGSAGWMLTPNPGGLPAIGNASFSLSIASTGGVPGLLAFSLAPLSSPLSVSGALVHVDPAQLFFFAPLMGSPVETIFLPIPLDNSLIGITFFLQAAHGTGGLIDDATEGLKITIL